MERTYGGTPLHQAFGMTLRVLGEGEVAVDFSGSANAGNRSAKTGGGILATLVDSAVVQACRSMLEPGAATATVELKVNFVRASDAGTVLTTFGRIDHLGRTLAVGNARVEDPAGQLIALGLVTVSIRRSAPVTELA